MCVRIAVFSVTVFYDERVVIVAEQRPDASEEDSFQWMSRVLQVNMEQCTKNLKKYQCKQSSSIFCQYYYTVRLRISIQCVCNTYSAKF